MLKDRRSPTSCPTSVVLACLLVATCPAAPVFGAVISIDSASLAVPGTVTTCVRLDSQGEEIVGTENELGWDDACAILDESSCMANPAHGKQLFASTDEFQFKALVLDFTDLSPIADGVLYCCDFTTSLDPGQCCSIAVERPGASDGLAQNIATAAGPPGLLCLEEDATPPSPPPTFPPEATATLVPGQTPVQPTASPDTRRVAEDDGCQVVAGTNHNGFLLLLAALPFAALRRAR